MITLDENFRLKELCYRLKKQYYKKIPKKIISQIFVPSSWALSYTTIFSDQTHPIGSLARQQLIYPEQHPTSIFGIDIRAHDRNWILIKFKDGSGVFEPITQVIKV